MAEATSFRPRHSKPTSSTDTSIIKLKAAFSRPKRKPVSVRASSISSHQPAQPKRRGRSVRFTYHSGISEILSISRNIDNVSVLVDHLHQRATPSVSFSPPPLTVPTPEVGKEARGRRKDSGKSTGKKESLLNSTLTSFTGSDVSQLYRKRGNDDPLIPVIKETKPLIVRRTRDLIREARPLLRL